MCHDATPILTVQSQPLAIQVRQRLLDYLAPLFRTLDQQLDRRLAVSFVETLQALLVWRHRHLALLLNEFGSYLAKPGHAPRSTKRLNNLHMCTRWRGDDLVAALTAQPALLVLTGLHL